MPSKPMRPCSVSGCPELVEKGRCPTHSAEQDRGRRQSETWRHAKGANGKTIDVYQTPRWKALRARVLREANYLCQCEECEQRPVGEPANTVDHIIPHHGDSGLMWDRRNLRAMSHAHHSRKTATETMHASPLRGARNDADVMTAGTSTDETSEAGRGAWQAGEGNGEPEGGIKSLPA